MYRHKNGKVICSEINPFIDKISIPVNEFISNIVVYSADFEIDFCSVFRNDFIKLYKYLISQVGYVTASETAIIFDILSFIEGKSVLENDSNEILCEKLQHSINNDWKTLAIPISILLLCIYDYLKKTNYLYEAKVLFSKLADFILRANGYTNEKRQEILLYVELKFNEINFDYIKEKYGNKGKGKDSIINKKKDISIPILAEAELPLKELSSLIGLNSVKKDIIDLTNYLKVQKMREEKGILTQTISRHLVFYGNPGTGKTTVARLIAEIYKGFGILKRGHLVETDRAGLVGQYIGDTEKNVKSIVNSAIGGVLFIDEAYSLYQGGDRDFGHVAIDTLVKMMEDLRDKFVVIVAGYPNKMKEFIQSNPGLKSRFNKYFHFNDYTPDELLKIFQVFSKKNQFELSLLALNELHSLFERYYKEKDESFGNARLVRNIFEKTLHNQANRVINIGNIDRRRLCTIEVEDIPQKYQIEEI